MKQIIPVISLLHESAATNSATRLFRDEPVLRWTLRRLGRVAGLASAKIVCWEDQSAAVDIARQVGSLATELSIPGPRRSVPEIDEVSAASRWSDGWRGGLLGTCAFDRGFHGPWLNELARSAAADGLLLIDPAAALIDPALITGLLDHAAGLPDLDLCFSQATPGLNGVLLSTTLLSKLATGRMYPGIMLTYRPDTPQHDPIADPACVPIPVPLARTSRRFSLDSQRQIDQLSAATAHLNGELIGTDAMGLLAAVDAHANAQIDRSVPRELVMELNTDRATVPIYWPGRRLSIARPPMTLERAKDIFRALAEFDDARLVLAGVGDPMLHPQVLEIIQAARDSSIAAITLETDFVDVPSERIAPLIESGVDIVSVHLPAARAATYAAVMGRDAFAEAVGNIRAFIELRGLRGAPLLVPTFVKCRQNQGEMEIWYDHWLRTLRAAVVRGPSDFAGLIEDVSPADMAGPRRRPCASLDRRLMVQSDGQFVSCEQDVLSRQSLGSTLEEASLALAAMRRDHRAGQWDKHPACAQCKQWHRL
ncbi:MAG: radical SAM protein [Tepidisphaeraceae bacterium]|jgi:hypothetical protein